MQRRLTGWIGVWARCMRACAWEGFAPPHQSHSRLHIATWLSPNAQKKAPKKRSVSARPAALDFRRWVEPSAWAGPSVGMFSLGHNRVVFVAQCARVADNPPPPKKEREKKKESVNFDGKASGHQITSGVRSQTPIINTSALSAAAGSNIYIYPVGRSIDKHVTHLQFYSAARLQAPGVKGRGCTAEPCWGRRRKAVITV